MWGNSHNGSGESGGTQNWAWHRPGNCINTSPFPPPPHLHTASEEEYECLAVHSQRLAFCVIIVGHGHETSRDFFQRVPGRLVSCPGLIIIKLLSASRLPIRRDLQCTQSSSGPCSLFSCPPHSSVLVFSTFFIYFASELYFISLSERTPLCPSKFTPTSPRLNLAFSPLRGSRREEILTTHKVRKEGSQHQVIKH